MSLIILTAIFIVLFYYSVRWLSRHEFLPAFAFHAITEQKIMMPSKNFLTVKNAPEETRVSGLAQNKADELSMEIDDLEWLLEKKKTELDAIHNQRMLADEAVAQLDIIEDTVNSIEAKLRVCQQQIGSVKNMAVELDELTIGYNHLQNQLAQSQHDYYTVSAENESLKEEFEFAIEELAAEKQEKLQLQKKITVLESLNADLEAMIQAIKQ
jgi:chromosome segregation ATPase